MADQKRFVFYTKGIESDHIQRTVYIRGLEVDNVNRAIYFSQALPLSQ